MAKRKRIAVRVWTAEDVRNLRAFAKARLSSTQAGKKLRRSRGAVAQKAITLKMRFRSINRRAR